MKCAYSSIYFLLPSFELLPVECPNCGAIRTLRHAPSESGNFYPDHVTLDGTARDRRRWKRVNDTWLIVEEESDDAK